ncbi:hypothetical protein CWI38_2339p0020 [Hamiltosporidium tvaerminnensis]|uniref:Uncharacterized protein n=1 Tax=Hamiltosporidium tvaerminnensis TaxID=1176355 RepID=A0A4Q9LL72_9MICR|nr:hypothetical protein CWI38_2339p0020 [Hamiltosporidium tvaerminnensis]
MFRSINKKDIFSSLKRINLEKEKIIEKYKSSVKDNTYEQLFEFEIEFPENKKVLNLTKKYALHNYIRKSDSKELEKLLYKNLHLDEFSLFLLIEKIIDSKRYILAIKLLHFTKNNHMSSVKYYELKRRIYKIYFQKEKNTI